MQGSGIKGPVSGRFPRLGTVGSLCSDFFENRTALDVGSFRVDSTLDPG